MERKDTGYESIFPEKGHLSAEKRARLADEDSTERREKRRKSREELTEKSPAKGKGIKANGSQTSARGTEGSRNDRVKSSTKQRKKNTKRQNNLLVAMLFAAVLVITAAVLVFVLKINTVEVINPSELYSNTSVIKYAGFDEGDSMLLINKKRSEQAIEVSLPYIENAEISRSWPDKIIITVSYAEPALAVDTGEGYVVLNESCKVLDRSSPVMPRGSALLKGVTFSLADEGRQAEFVGNIDKAELISLVTALKENGFSEISCYDLTQLSDVTITIDNRVDVKFGTLAGATEKFAFGKEVIARTAEKDTKHRMIVDLSTEDEAYVRTVDDNSVEVGEPPSEEQTTVSEETDIIIPEPQQDTTQQQVVVG